MKSSKWDIKNNPEIDSERNKFWYNSKGMRHREDGPAEEYTNGDKFWWKNGKLHREDGPSFHPYKQGSCFHW